MWELLFYFVLLLCFFSFLSLAPWVPTKACDLERIHRLLNLQKNKKFLEIGCGNARVSMYLARHNPESYITGIEFSPLMFIISWFRVKLSRLKNIDVIYGNALKLDMTRYDILYVFGLPETITKKLFPKLKLELKKTARFYSYCFKMTNSYFKETQYKPNPKTYSIYEYSHKK